MVVSVALIGFKGQTEKSRDLSPSTVPVGKQLHLEGILTLKGKQMKERLLPAVTGLRFKDKCSGTTSPVAFDSSTRAAS